MEFILVEVTPKGGVNGNGYCASLKGDGKILGDGKSVEEAIVTSISSHPDIFKITADDITDAAWENNRRLTDRKALRNLIHLLIESGYVLDIKFFPAEYR